MQPLYIAATDTIIRNASEKYVHPVTGEVYGRSDYENPAKLAEIGAVPLTEESVPEGFTASEWEIVEVDGKYVRRPKSVTAIPVETVQDQKIAEVKAQASRALRESDWRMLRAIERFIVGELDPEGQEIAAEREAIRDASTAAEAQIREAKTIREVKAVLNVEIPLITKE
jgi:hypothetical protein